MSVKFVKQVFCFLNNSQTSELQASRQGFRSILPQDIASKMECNKGISAISHDAGRSSARSAAEQRAARWPCGLQRRRRPASGRALLQPAGDGGRRAGGAQRRSGRAARWPCGLQLRRRPASGRALLQPASNGGEPFLVSPFDVPAPLYVFSRSATAHS